MKKQNVEKCNIVTFFTFPPPQMSSLVKHRDDQSTNEANTLQFKNIIEARYRIGFLQNLNIQSYVFVVLSNFKEVARKAKKKRIKLIILFH